MIPIGSTTLVNLTGHQDSVTGAWINNATVTASVLDGTTSLFSTTLSYVSASNGNYQGTFTAAQTSNLEDGKAYVVEYVATSGYGTLTVRDEEVAGYN